MPKIKSEIVMNSRHNQSHESLNRSLSFNTRDMQIKESFQHRFVGLRLEKKNSNYNSSNVNMNNSKINQVLSQLDPLKFANTDNQSQDKRIHTLADFQKSVINKIAKKNRTKNYSQSPSNSKLKLEIQKSTIIYNSQYSVGNTPRNQPPQAIDEKQHNLSITIQEYQQSFQIKPHLPPKVPSSKLTSSKRIQVDKTLLIQSQQQNKEKLKETLILLQKDFFSCPLVDEPDPEEKKLAVYAETEIRKYLKQEKIRRIEERKKLVTMLLELKKEEEQNHGGFSEYKKKLQSADKDKMRSSSGLSKKETFQGLIRKQSKVHSIQQIQRFKNEEISELEMQDQQNRSLVFYLETPKGENIANEKIDPQTFYQTQSTLSPKKKDQFAHVFNRLDTIVTFKKKQKENEENIKSSSLRMTLDRKTKLKKLFVRSLIDSVNLMQELGLNIQDITTGKVFPDQAFQRGSIAKQFLHAARDGDLQTLQELMNRDRFIVYEHDHVGQTALHWAAKRGNCEIIKILIKNGIKVNQRDMAGRTALFVSSKKGQLSSLKALLAGKANPGIRTHSGITCLQAIGNEKMKGFIAKAMLLHICLPLIPSRRRNYVWQCEGLQYFESPDHVTISDFA